MNRDKQMEEYWVELEDILFVECEDGELILNDNWLHFDKGTGRETIWYWFDDNHSKGVAWLLNDFEY